MIRRTGFKRPTYEQIIKAQQKQREKALQRLREGKKPRVIPIACIKRTGAPCSCKKCVRKAERKAKGLPPTKAERVKTLKTKLWAMFSKYIRAKYADRTGMLTTADGKRMHWKEAHCGHLFHNTERNQQLGGNELWYYENNFAPQSMAGNYFNKDDSAKVYMMWAISLYGEEEVAEMRRMKERPREFTEEELQAKYEHYRREFDKIGL